MPWRECCPMDERLRFIARFLHGEKMAGPCREIDISPRLGSPGRRRPCMCSVFDPFSVWVPDTPTIKDRQRGGGPGSDPSPPKPHAEPVTCGVSRLPRVHDRPRRRLLDRTLSFFEVRESPRSRALDPRGRGRLARALRQTRPHDVPVPRGSESVSREQREGCTVPGIVRRLQ